MSIRWALQILDERIAITFDIVLHFYHSLPDQGGLFFRTHVEIFCAGLEHFLEYHVDAD
jgi:hypothetical protein